MVGPEVLQFMMEYTHEMWQYVSDIIHPSNFLLVLSGVWMYITDMAARIFTLAMFNVRQLLMLDFSLDGLESLSRALSVERWVIVLVLIILCVQFGSSKFLRWPAILFLASLTLVQLAMYVVCRYIVYLFELMRGLRFHRTLRRKVR